MKSGNLTISRRQFLHNIVLGTIALASGQVYAGDLIHTPRQTEGPFYPNRLPLDTDNDLVVINNAGMTAEGEITHLTGRVLGSDGAPVRNAVVEIWHVDNNGIYLHTRSPKRIRHDKNFQGFGRFLTGSDGKYYFRTIKPVPYTFGVTRTPHIHVIVRKGERRLLTTQMYVKGHPMNKQDFIFQSIRSKAERESVLVDFKPVKGSRGELSARFDIVLGRVPEDLSEDRYRERDGMPVN